MNNVELLLLSLEGNPDDLTAVACLTDALMEEQDMTRSEADRHAERAVESARNTRDLATAAELLKKEQPWYHELIRDILDRCGLSHALVASVVLIPGDSAPLHGEQRQHVASGWWTEHTITVGAMWVIKYWRSNPPLCLMARAKKKRRARPR